MLTQEQAEKFYRDGFLHLKGIVPQTLVQAARRTIYERMGRLRVQAAITARNGDMESLAQATRLMGRSGGSAEIMNLLNASPVIDFVECALGAPLYPVRGAQLATLYPAEDDFTTNEAGYRNVDTPHHGWCPHLDGLWNGGIATPAAGSTLAVADEQRWYSDPSTNGGTRYYPEHNTCIANFTGLIGIALSDQRVVGSGNLGLLRGGHHHMETFFLEQHARGGPLGPEGPGWPREDRNAPNGHGLVHYPEAVRRRYRRGAGKAPDGSLWPKPTWMRPQAGDAILVHYATPHSASRVMTSDPRLMVYFRATSSVRKEENLRVYPAALCDNWLEWPGIRRYL